MSIESYNVSNPKFPMFESIGNDELDKILFDNGWYCELNGNSVEGMLYNADPLFLVGVTNIGRYYQEGSPKGPKFESHKSFSKKILRRWIEYAQRLMTRECYLIFLDEIPKYIKTEEDICQMSSLLSFATGLKKIKRGSFQNKEEYCKILYELRCRYRVDCGNSKEAKKFLIKFIPWGAAFVKFIQEKESADFQLYKKRLTDNVIENLIKTMEQKIELKKGEKM